MDPRCDLRVLVVEEGLGLTQAWLLAFRRRFPVRVLGPVFDEAPAHRIMTDGLADLVAVDLHRADGRAEAIIADLAGAGMVHVVGALETEDRPEEAARALASGARGVVARDEPARMLSDSLRRAAAGDLVLPASHLPGVIDRIRARPADMGVASLGVLTRREREILGLLARGMAIADIAGLLAISRLTVQSHVKSILAKLGLHSKVEAVTLAWRAGLTIGERSA